MHDIFTFHFWKDGTLLNSYLNDYLNAISHL
jgi:hypothetical protein